MRTTPTDFGTVSDHGLNVWIAPGSEKGSRVMLLMRVRKRPTGKLHVDVKWGKKCSSVHCVVVELGWLRLRSYVSCWGDERKRSHCPTETDPSSINTADRCNSPLLHHRQMNRALHLLAQKKKALMWTNNHLFNPTVSYSWESIA